MAVVLVGAMSGGRQAKAAEPLVIAVPAATAGRFAEHGRAIHRAATMFADANRAMGAPAIEVRPMPDGCTTDAFDAAALDAAAAGAQVVIGHACGPSALLAGPRHAAAGRLFIATSAPPPARPRDDPTLYLPVADASPAHLMARALADGPSKRIAVVSDRSRLSLDLAQAIVDALQASGLTVDQRERIEAGRRTFDTLARQLGATAITDVVLTTFPTEAAALAGDLRAVAPAIGLWGTHLVDAPDFARLAGAAGNGVRFLRRLGADDVATASARTWVARLRAAGETPTLETLATIAALDMVASAYRAAGAAVTQPLRTALGETTATVLGPMAFDSQGLARLPLWRWWRWQDGRAIAD
jgi:ABC-type branched-subunit amino acid transport system substrate-binding protein